MLHMFINTSFPLPLSCSRTPAAMGVLFGISVPYIRMFPTISGLPAPKKCVVESICNIAKHLGLAGQTKSGAPRFTGHTFRVSGAMWLASSGIDIWRIQLHGRWGSSAVVKYVRLAPLARSLALEVSFGRDLSDVRTAILQAKATFADDQSPTWPLQNSLEAALGPTLAAPAKYLGTPLLDQILGNTTVQGWNRPPKPKELLTSNIGPPNFDGKFHTLRPPRQWDGPAPSVEDWDPLVCSKAWCSFNFVTAGGRCEFRVWKGNDEDLALPLCGRCFGTTDAKQAARSSSSSSASSES